MTDLYALNLFRLENKYEEERLRLLIRVVNTQMNLLLYRVQMVKDSRELDREDLIMIGAQIEDLIGMSAVVIQTSITNVVTICMQIYNHAGSSGVTLGKKFSSKADILKISRSQLLFGYTEMEVLNAAANMFKHKDEWGLWTSKLNSKKVSLGEKETLKLLMAIGCTQDSFSNFKKIFKILLKHSEYGRSLELVDEFIKWKDEVSNALMIELVSKGLIK